MKKKIKRFNNNPYSKKRLYNAIMCHSRLKSVSNKTHTSFIYVFTKTHQRDCVIKLRDNQIFKALLWIRKLFKTIDFELILINQGVMK